MRAGTPVISHLAATAAAIPSMSAPAGSARADRSSSSSLRLSEWIPHRCAAVSSTNEPLYPSTPYPTSCSSTAQSTTTREGFTALSKVVAHSRHDSRGTSYLAATATTPAPRSWTIPASSSADGSRVRPLAGMPATARAPSGVGAMPPAATPSCTRSQAKSPAATNMTSGAMDPTSAIRSRAALDQAGNTFGRTPPLASMARSAMRSSSSSCSTRLTRSSSSGLLKKLIGGQI
mmetsp:Transcript_3026/g.13640  ORF Transcript_3026/g.13640 Transcript_3026/m.13640 type:complete len:233 (-) Transcript_3026:157-855(-)